MLVRNIEYTVPVLSELATRKLNGDDMQDVPPALASLLDSVESEEDISPFLEKAESKGIVGSSYDDLLEKASGTVEDVKAFLQEDDSEEDDSEEEDEDPEDFRSAGAVIVMVPADSDPVSSASSEDAHMTVAWLGPSSDIEDIQAVEAEVEEAASTMGGPRTLRVTGQGTLGKDSAEVVHLEASPEALSMREFLLSRPSVKSAYDSVEQFDSWKPHVTLGYPETPKNSEYEGKSITFDRLALWAGNDHKEFPIT